MAVSNMSKGIEAAKDIVNTTGQMNLSVRKLDLASMDDVRKFAQQINDTEPRLDILILNAGISALTRKYLTEDNLELHMASNHLGHFLLTNLLLPLLCETSIIKHRPRSDPVRIVVVSSVLHWYGKIELDNLNSEKYFEPSRIYADTKLANLLFTFELNSRLKAEGYHNVIVNATHPGPILEANLYCGWIMKLLMEFMCYTTEEGAQSTIYCGVSEEVTEISGKYFSGCRLTKSSPQSQDPLLARALWERSAFLVDLMPHETAVRVT